MPKVAERADDDKWRYSVHLCKLAQGFLLAWLHEHLRTAIKGHDETEQDRPVQNNEHAIRVHLASDEKRSHQA